MTTTIDIDTGGTFTDGYVVRDGVPHMVKVLTTPHDLAVCFRDVLAAAAGALDTSVGAMLRDAVSVRYATTVGTNAVVQRRGPRLGLLVGRDAPRPDARSGVGLFVDDGMVAAVAPPAAGTNGAGPAASLVEIRSLLDDGARGLVGSLDAGEAEADLRAVFEEHYPLHCLDTVPLLLAGEVSPEEEPARRTATALFNAYVHPDVADFLYRAEDHLRDEGYRRPLLVVHNDGGASRVAKTVAGKTYNSGPLAGLLGAAALARRLGIDELVTLDMGGTSLDVAVVRGGEVPMRRHGVVEGVEIALPLPDLVPLGAGGGSIAWLDGDVLRVGPRSAGAAPGPACFGLGGEEPTLTDADVVLGILRPEAFMGGRMTLDVEGARRAIARIAEPLSCTVEEAAERIRETVHEEAGRALAALLDERGVDPAQATVLAFGGNGATHGAGIAEAAGIPVAVTTPLAPVFSAFGASTADVRHRREARADVPEAALRDAALRDMRGEGFAAQDVEVVVREESDDGRARRVVEAIGRLPHSDDGTLGAVVATAPPGAVHGTRVRWPGCGELETAVCDRASLGAGDTVTGPALVESGTTTCAVPPGWTLTVDEHGAERLRHEREETR